MQTALEEFLLVNPLRDQEQNYVMTSMTKRLCTEYVDHRGLEAILANRLIPLDKGEGAVRLIGVGEVLRRIMGKCHEGHQTSYYRCEWLFKSVRWS